MMDNRICFVINTLKVGGAAKMLKFVANSLVDDGWKISIITTFDKIECKDLNSNIIQYNLGINSNDLFWRIKEMPILRKVIKNEPAQIICAFVTEVAVMTRLSTLGLSKIIISAERGDPFTKPLFWKPIINWCYKKSDFLIFQLERQRDYFGQEILNKSYVIPNPYIPNYNVELRTNNRKYNKTIVTAGRFVVEKQYDVLLKAFFLVYKKHPEYNLVMYGEGPEIYNYKKMVKRMGIEKSVFFPGYVKNVAEKIINDGIFVLSSKSEGIPNSLLEAMSIGIPTVSTDCTPGGPAFLTNGGKRGLLVPVGDYISMASSISSLIEDSVLYERLQSMGPEINNILNSEVIKREWIKVFNNIKHKSYAYTFTN